MWQPGTCHLLQGCVWVSGWAQSSRCFRPQGDELVSPSERSNSEQNSLPVSCNSTLSFSCCFWKTKQLSSFHAALTLSQCQRVPSQSHLPCVQKAVSRTCVEQQWHPVVPTRPVTRKHLRSSVCRVQLWMMNKRGLHWTQRLSVPSLLESLNKVLSVSPRVMKTLRALSWLKRDYTFDKGRTRTHSE